MAVIRKRLIFWLIKAYIKKSGKTIFFSFLFGLIIFSVIVFTEKYYSHIFPFTHTQTIGLVGAYTEDALPPKIVNKMSFGLTSVAPDSTIKSELASSWDVMDNGKTYKFHLKPGLYFNDGQEVNAETINYNFSDVTVKKPDAKTIIFTLKDAYAPFLVTISKPLFNKGFSGVGEYRLEKIKLNGNFVQSLTLASTKNRQYVINYVFYPSEDALKIAYLLGEVTEVDGLSKSSFKDTSLEAFPNTRISKKVNYSQLVTLFFNNNDSDLSDKKLRLALTYALPDNFKDGKRTYAPYSSLSSYYNKNIEARNQDFAHAKLLLLPDKESSVSGQAHAPTQLTIKTLKKYRQAAEEIATAWKSLGITTKIEEVEGIPNIYQVFLGDFNIPRDPDQYTLWHSNQPNNITRYKNLRIDKLLEDGRKTVDSEQRKKIYADFQKFLLEDAPAAFLYFPYEYDVMRK